MPEDMGTSSRGRNHREENVLDLNCFKAEMAFVNRGDSLDLSFTLVVHTNRLSCYLIP